MPNNSTKEIDEVTGLLTRETFIDQAERILSENLDKEYNLIVADIEKFSFVNRLYGRAFGDKVLRYFGDSFRDAAEEMVCGRIGGDQFALLMLSSEKNRLEDFYDLAEKIKNDAPVPYLTVKYGIYKHVDKNDSVHDMFDKALLAIQGKKNFHDDPFSFYNEEVIEKHLRARMYEAEFERAMAESQFIVMCQPKYNTNDKTMVSAEALVRWRGSDGKFIMPGDFIPVFENDGLIVKLDEYIFKLVCLRQKELLVEGKNPLPVSVNMSCVSLFSQGIIERYKAIIEEIGIPKRLVPIELTESATVEMDKINRIFDEFKYAGFALHMDDFGSGYSSLSYLASIHFDAIKLDKSLIDGIGTTRGEEIIRHTIEMAHFFRMEVVAEGVEERSQYAFLRKLNCDTIQGYYFSKPVSYEEFIKMCESQEKANKNRLAFIRSRKTDEEYEDAGEEERKPGIRGFLQNIGRYKGERNDTYKANEYTLKCMWVSFIVFIICWLLDVMGIFIVDLQIMTNGILGAAIICLLTYLYAKFRGVDRSASRYVILFAIIAMLTVTCMSLSYHTMLTMIFPFLCAMMYFDKKVTVFTYIATCIGYAVAVLVGYKVGLCDANMILLTYTNSAFHSAALLSGDFTINNNMFLNFAFFVFPRWLVMLALMPLLSHVAKDIRKRTNKEAKIRHLAEIDGLTGVYNRYKFVQEVNNYYPACDSVAVLYFDIDNLKATNDTRGHESGDKLICGLSQELLKRESDNCKSYRVGGDEFIMVLEGNDARRVNEVARGISRLLRGKKIDDNLVLSVSVGTASGKGSDIESIVNEADEQMYKNKLQAKKENA